MRYNEMVLIVFLVVFTLCIYVYCFSHNITPDEARKATSSEAQEIGDYGERQVNNELSKTMISTDKLIHNYIFFDKAGNSHQIDHILINNKGVWVIETKNYSGSIYGGIKSSNWYQYFKNGYKVTFLNPLKQNAQHLACLYEFIPFKVLRNIVCFVGSADLSHMDNDKRLLYLEELNKAVSSGEFNLSLEKQQEIYNILLEHRSKLTLEEHIRNLHSNA